MISRAAIEAPTPTAAEPWRCEIEHGPDGEASFAWVYDSNGFLVCTAETHHAKAIVERMNALLPDKVDETYLVWSNEHAAWWGPNRCCYNTHISHAGRYTRAEAIKICNGARGGREFNRNPSEVPIRLRDAEAFWTEAGLQERYEREARDRDDDLCDGDPL